VGNLVRDRYIRPDGPEAANDALVEGPAPVLRVVGPRPAVQALFMTILELLQKVWLYETLLSGAQNLHASRLTHGRLAFTSVAVVDNLVPIRIPYSLVQTTGLIVIQNSELAVGRGSLYQTLHALCGLKIGPIIIIVQAFAVRKVIRATVGVNCPITECIAVAESSKYWDAAAILAPVTAFQGWVGRPAVVPRNVPVRRGPARSYDGHRHHARQQTDK